MFPTPEIPITQSLEPVEPTIPEEVQEELVNGLRAQVESAEEDITRYRVRAELEKFIQRLPAVAQIFMFPVLEMVLGKEHITKQK